jgi:hypothetical protein
MALVDLWARTYALSCTEAFNRVWSRLDLVHTQTATGWTSSGGGHVVYLDHAYAVVRVHYQGRDYTPEADPWPA